MNKIKELVNRVSDSINGEILKRFYEKVTINVESDKNPKIARYKYDCLINIILGGFDGVIVDEIKFDVDGYVCITAVARIPKKKIQSFDFLMMTWEGVNDYKTYSYSWKGCKEDYCDYWFEF